MDEAAGPPGDDAAVLAIDLGTSHVKAALIGSDGRFAAEAQAPLTTERAAGGHRQQAVAGWRRALQAVVAACSAAEGSRPPAAIALTGQMQDLVLLDEHGDATHPVLLHSDTRAQEALTELLTANPAWAPGIAVAPLPGPDAVPPKLLHLARTAPSAVAAASTLHVSAPGWATHALCGAHVCDRLTASTTSAYDPRPDDWIGLRAGDGGSVVPPHLSLPALVDPGVVGAVTAEAARTYGVAAGTPVVMALGDAGSATDGMVGSAPGSAYLHLGTTGWVAYVDPTPADELPRPVDTGSPVDRHRLAHPSGNLVIARLPAAGEALEHARRDLLGLADPHTEAAHAVAEAALVRARETDPSSDQGDRGPAATAVAYAAAVASLAADAAGLLERLEVQPSRVPATGGVVRSGAVRTMLEEAVGAPLDLIPDAEAGLVSCARVAFDALGISHTVSPLVERGRRRPERRGRTDP